MLIQCIVTSCFWPPAPHPQVGSYWKEGTIHALCINGMGYYSLSLSFLICELG